MEVITGFALPELDDGHPCTEDSFHITVAYLLLPQPIAESLQETKQP